MKVAGVALRNPHRHTSPAELAAELVNGLKGAVPQALATVDAAQKPHNRLKRLPAYFAAPSSESETSLQMPSPDAPARVHLPRSGSVSRGADVELAIGIGVIGAELDNERLRSREFETRLRAKEAETQRLYKELASARAVSESVVDPIAALQMRQSEEAERLAEKHAKEVAEAQAALKQPTQTGMSPQSTTPSTTVTDSIELSMEERRTLGIIDGNEPLMLPQIDNSLDITLSPRSSSSPDRSELETSGRVWFPDQIGDALTEQKSILEIDSTLKLRKSARELQQLPTIPQRGKGVNNLIGHLDFTTDAVPSQRKAMGADEGVNDIQINQKCTTDAAPSHKKAEDDNVLLLDEVPDVDSWIFLSTQEDLPLKHNLTATANADMPPKNALTPKRDKELSGVSITSEGVDSVLCDSGVEPEPMADLVANQKLRVVAESSGADRALCDTSNVMANPMIDLEGGQDEELPAGMMMAKHLPELVTEIPNKSGTELTPEHTLEMLADPELNTCDTTSKNTEVTQIQEVDRDLVVPNKSNELNPFVKLENSVKAPGMQVSSIGLLDCCSTVDVAADSSKRKTTKARETDKGGSLKSKQIWNNYVSVRPREGLGMPLRTKVGVRMPKQRNYAMPWKSHTLPNARVEPKPTTLKISIPGSFSKTTDAISMAVAPTEYERTAGDKASAVTEIVDFDKVSAHSMEEIPDSLTCRSLEEALISHGFGPDTAQIFEENDVTDLDTLRQLDKASLESLGFKVGTIVKLQRL